MCSSSIPYFKEIIIMSFNCESCGVHSVEVKTGGALSAKGRKITLKVDNLEDLGRDLYKSDSAYLCIPELELELEYGTLGGVFTTVEGILEKIKSHL
jgi:zinc finger protein